MIRQAGTVIAVLLAVVLQWVATPTALAQAAPKLTSMRVVAVASQRYPQYEMILANQFTTKYDQGGSYLIVVTEEIGYANPPTRLARFNGVKMTLGLQESLLSGRTVIGWRNYWLYSASFTSGTFTYQATSINSPWNTMSTWITIR